MRRYLRLSLSIHCPPIGGVFCKGDRVIDGNTQHLSLSDVSDTHLFEVLSVEQGQIEVSHLEDLGFLPGTRISRVGQAPLGDPVVYNVRGTRFAMRKSDAAQVLVKPVDDAVVPTTDELLSESVA